MFDYYNYYNCCYFAHKIHAIYYYGRETDEIFNVQVMHKYYCLCIHFNSENPKPMLSYYDKIIIRSIYKTLIAAGIRITRGSAKTYCSSLRPPR